ncbi:MAG: tetratricopeptide repeat protein [Pseudomonadota bacterium]
MDAYDSEKEQIEKIKKWWDANGNAIIVGLVLGLGGIFGYRYWENSKMLAGESASTNYEHLVIVSQAGASDEATTAADAIIANQPDSPYAKMAALVSAKLAVDANDFETAKQRLQWVIDHPKKSELSAIAIARLSQILLNEGNVAASSTLFESLNSDEKGRFVELSGDILLAEGDTDAARKAYELAVLQAEKFGIDLEPVQLKLDNLNFLQAQTPNTQ